MNLLARILSHGFAIAIVLLLAIGLIYRGELFPDWEHLNSSRSGRRRKATGQILRQPKRRKQQQKRRPVSQHRR